MRNFAFAGTIAGIKFFPAFMLAIAVTLFTSPIRRTCDKGTGPEIVVDKSYIIQPGFGLSMLGEHNDIFRDGAICCLKSVLPFHHTEEKVSDGEQGTGIALHERLG